MKNSKKKTLLEIISEAGLTVTDLAVKLDVSTSQIYQWNKKGISPNNKHFDKLKEILPEVLPRSPTLTVDALEDRRYNAGQKRKQLQLTDTDIETPVEKEFISSQFPRITRKKAH